MPNTPTPPVTLPGGLIYPPDLVTADRSVTMQFQFGMYQRPSLFSLPTVAIGGTPIVLPMPERINDHPMVVWEEHSVLSDAAQLATQGVDYAASLGIPGASTIAGAGGVLGKGINAVGYLGGWIVNPFLTMLFKSPAFKEFQFSWTFAPESQKESLILQQILEVFRTNMMPDKGSTLLTLGYPNILYMAFVPNDFLFNFKPCAVRDITFDYTPAGPAFLKVRDNTGTQVSSAPALVKMTLHVTEMEYWLRSDPGL